MNTVPERRKVSQVSFEDSQRIATLTAEVAAMHRENERRDEAIEAMAADIKELLALANQSRGALWLGMSFASLMGGILSWIFSHMSIKGGL